MGDPATKHILTVVHGSAVYCAANAVKLLHRVNVLWTINGDDMLALLTKDSVKTFLDTYREKCNHYGLLLSRLDCFAGPFGFYCEEIMKAPKGLFDLYTRSITAKRELLYRDIGRANLLNTFPVSSGSIYESLIGRVEMLGRESTWQRPGIGDETSSRMARLKTRQCIQWFLFGNRIRQTWLCEPLSHSNYIPLPRYAEPVLTRQHRWIIHLIVDIWGWEGNSYNPVSSTRIQTIRQRQFRKGLHLSEITIPPDIKPVEIDRRIQGYTSLVDFFPYLLTGTDIATELIKRLSTLDLLFGGSRTELFNKVTPATIPTFIEGKWPERPWNFIAGSFKFAFRNWNELYTPESLTRWAFGVTEYNLIERAQRGDGRFTDVILNGSFIKDEGLRLEDNQIIVLVFFIAFKHYAEEVSIMTNDNKLVKKLRKFLEFWGLSLRVNQIRLTHADDIFMLSADIVDTGVLKHSDYLRTAIWEDEDDERPGSKLVPVLEL
jgi:hypothetical protein